LSASFVNQIEGIGLTRIASAKRAVRLDRVTPFPQRVARVSAGCSHGGEGKSEHDECGGDGGSMHFGRRKGLLMVVVIVVGEDEDEDDDDDGENEDSRNQDRGKMGSTYIHSTAPPFCQKPKSTV
jgi:hypothetical protein